MTEVERELDQKPAVRDEGRVRRSVVPPRKPIRGHKQPKRSSGASVVIVLSLIVAGAVVGVRLFQSRSDALQRSARARTPPTREATDATNTTTTT